MLRQWYNFHEVMTRFVNYAGVKLCSSHSHVFPRLKFISGYTLGLYSLLGCLTRPNSLSLLGDDRFDPVYLGALNHHSATSCRVYSLVELGISARRQSETRYPVGGCIWSFPGWGCIGSSPGWCLFGTEGQGSFVCPQNPSDSGLGLCRVFGVWLFSFLASTLSVLSRLYRPHWLSRLLWYRHLDWCGPVPLREWGGGPRKGYLG